MTRYLTMTLESSKIWYLMLMLATCPMWINLPQDGVIAGGDAGVPFYRSTSSLLNAIYMWSDYNGGARSWGGLPRLPELLLQTFFIAIGFPSALSQKFYFVLEYFIAGASMYYLVNSLFRDDSKKRLAGFLSGIVYMYNPYTLVYGATLWYGVIPFVLAAYINGLESKSNTKYSIYIVVAFFATITTFPTYSHIISTLIPPLLYTALCALWRELDLQRLWFGFKTSILLAVSNIWWLIPTWLTYPKLAISKLPLMEFTHKYSTILEVMRRLGAWQIYESAQGVIYFQWAREYLTNPTMVLLSIIPICLFSYVMISRPRDRRILFFSVLTIIAFFLAKGRNPPFGWFYDWLLRSLPFFVAYRESMRFAVLISLSLSLIFGVAATDMAERANRIIPRRSIAQHTLMKPIRYLIPVGLVILVLLPAWPFFTGDIFTNFYNPPNKGVKVPSYYEEANTWLDEHAGLSRLFLVPKQGLYVAYDWGYQGRDPSSQLFSKPVIEPGSGGYATTSSQRTIDLAYSLLENCSNGKFTAAEDRKVLSKLIGLLSARFVVLETAVDTDFYSLPAVSKTAAVFDSSPWNGSNVRYGKLWIYNNAFFAPRVYATSNVRVIKGSFGDMLRALKDDELVPGETALVNSSTLSPIQQEIIDEVATHRANPTVSFERINPTNYVVHIENATHPFILILSESYDDGWRARIYNYDLSDHVVANGYANAWLVNKTGTFDTVIEYQPQSSASLFSSVSVLGAALWLIFLLIYENQERSSLRQLHKGSNSARYLVHGIKWKLREIHKTFK